MRDWREELAACQDDRERLAYATELLSEILDADEVVSAYGAVWGLTPAEARILGRLARQPGYVVPHDALAAMVHEDTDRHAITVHIARIRRKTGLSIRTSHGAGYALQQPVPVSGDELRALVQTSIRRSNRKGRASDG